MVTKTLLVQNDEGMHMRPAGMIAAVAKEHPDCEVNLTANGKTVKASSPMQIMSACIKKGSMVEIACSGADEESVLNKISLLFESNFGE